MQVEVLFQIGINLLNSVFEPLDVLVKSEFEALLVESSIDQFWSSFLNSSA